MFCNMIDEIRSKYIKERDNIFEFDDSNSPRFRSEELRLNRFHKATPVNMPENSTFVLHNGKARNHSRKLLEHERNRASYNARKAQRLASERQATPPWLTKEQKLENKEFYLLPA
jgi:hypothetical protein